MGTQIGTELGTFDLDICTYSCYVFVVFYKFLVNEKESNDTSLQHNDSICSAHLTFY